jgi:TonB family C-terminal domain
MEANTILQASYLDLVFAGRNKAYGSYELRNGYAQRMKMALGLVTAAVILLVASSYIKSEDETHGAEAAIRQMPVTMTTIVLPQRKIELPKPIEQPAAPAAKPTVKLTPPKIVADDKVIEPPVDVTKMGNKEAGPTTTTGTPGGEHVKVIDYPPGDVVVAKPATEPVKFSEVMPAPGYDVQAYLYKQVRYPQAAKENNIQGRVQVQFVVNEDGSISNAQVVGRRYGGGLEEEAIRVVMALPKWTPGKQNGRAVKVYFTMPISFKLE